MKVVAICNLKGGVGKTTSAVNLSYLAAASGHRTLLWDLDPQAASSYAFRIEPEVAGFGKRTLENGAALNAAIKQTDYSGLFLLPADFAYRKFDRLLSTADDPTGPFRSLLDTIGRDFDLVLLDCPAGYSRLTEAILTTADGIVAPTLPTVLSLRMISQLLEQMARCRSRSTIAAVLSMVDRRKTLHRRARELASAQPGIFLTAEIPYASVVEQMASRRLPIHAFAAGEPAAAAFDDIWAELQIRLRRERDCLEDRRWDEAIKKIEALIEQLQSPERAAAGPRLAAAAGDTSQQRSLDIVHRFDTDPQDLERQGHVIELRELDDGIFVIVARLAASAEAPGGVRVDARIDRSWTVRILAGELSPFEALERRVGPSQKRAVERIRAAAGGRQLRRVETRESRRTAAEERASADNESALSAATGQVWSSADL